MTLMDIYYFGFTSIRLRGKKTTLVIDPFSKETAGLKFEKTEADAVLLTAKNSPRISLDQVSNSRVVIDGPGEYEVGGVAIHGIAIDGIATYVVKIDGVTMLHLGDISNPLSDSEIEKYPSIDILFVYGGKDTADMIAKLEPKIVVPLNFTNETLDAFLKELGKESVKPVSKLTITKEKLPSEMEVVVLGNA